MLTKFQKFFPIFLDRLFDVVYEWLWLAFTMFIGLLVMEIYLPGALAAMRPAYSALGTTVLSLSFVLVMLKKLIEPVVGQFLHTKIDEGQNDEQPLLAENK